MIILGRKVVNKNWNQPPEALLYNIESLHKCIPFPFAVNNILPAFKSGCTVLCVRLLTSCRYSFHQSDCNGFWRCFICAGCSLRSRAPLGPKNIIYFGHVYTVCIFPSGMCMLMHRSSLACLGKWGKKKEILAIVRTSAAPLFKYGPSHIFTELCQHKRLLPVHLAKT